MARVPTLEMRKKFLELVADGKNRADAANAVGSTGSAFRSLCRRNPDFNTAYEEALTTGKAGLRDTIRQTLLHRALDGTTQGSDRLLLVLAETHLPELAWRREQRVHHDHSGRVEVAVDVEVALAEVRAQLARVVPLNGRLDTPRLALDAGEADTG